MPNSRVSIFLQHICSAARKTVEVGGRETLHFLCNNAFRVGMLEVNSLIARLVGEESGEGRHGPGSSRTLQ